MTENGGREEEEEKMEEENDEKKMYKVLMWGYLPGVLSHKSPLTSPVAVQSPETGIDDQSWKDVCGGGCGFAMAISAGSGKLITWGSADDQGQSYLTSGKHGKRMMCTHGAGKNVCLLPRLLQILLLVEVLKGMLFGKKVQY